MYMVCGVSPVATPRVLSLRYPCMPSKYAPNTEWPPIVIFSRVALTGASGTLHAPPGGAVSRWFASSDWSKMRMM